MRLQKIACSTQVEKIELELELRQKIKDQNLDKFMWNKTISKLTESKKESSRNWEELDFQN